MRCDPRHRVRRRSVSPVRVRILNKSYHEYNLNSMYRNSHNDTKSEGAQVLNFTIIIIIIIICTLAMLFCIIFILTKLTNLIQGNSNQLRSKEVWCFSIDSCQ